MGTLEKMYQKIFGKYTTIICLQKCFMLLRLVLIWRKNGRKHFICLMTRLRELNIMVLLFQCGIKSVSNSTKLIVSRSQIKSNRLLCAKIYEKHIIPVSNNELRGMR